MTKIKSFQNKVKILKYLYLVIEITIFISLLWFYASHSQLLPDPSKPYSSCIAYRLQTNAFLQGKLSLSPRPFGAQHDFHWTENGLFQNWGFGVPLLRIPFEWTAQLFGFNPFPDKLIVLFYLALMVIILNQCFKLVFTPLGLTSHTAKSLLIRWFLISWILFCSVIANLITYDMGVYHEAIFYGYIYTCILFSLFWVNIRTPNNMSFLTLCLLSGLGYLIRPTLIFYGLTTFSLAVIYVYQYSRNIRLIFWGTLCFGLSAFVNLWLNYICYGSIFDFGYASAITGSPPDFYGLRFLDYPFKREPFLSAAKELLGILFFKHPWLSPTFRMRELSFSTFNIIHLIVLMGGVILFIISSFFKLSKQIFLNKSTHDLLKLLYYPLSWGLISFSFLFIFYLRCIGMSSRYCCDFSAALNAIFIVLILLGAIALNSYCDRHRNKKIFFIFFVAAGTLFYFCNNAFFITHSAHGIEMTNKSIINKLVTSFNQDSLLNPLLPETFYCGQSSPDYKLPHQFAGWDISRDCQVNSASSIFLPSKKCITLNYSFSNLKQCPPIQAKRNLVFLKLTTSQIIKSSPTAPSKEQITQRFCSDSFPSNSVALYTIGWTLTKDIGWDKLPITLNWVSVSENKR